MLQLSVKINNSQYNALIRRLENLAPNLKKQLALDTQTTANELVASAKSYAHVRTGAMKASITSQKTGETSYKVYAGVDYAVYENARGSPHDFMEQAIADVDPKFYRRLETSVKDIVARK